METWRLRTRIPIALLLVLAAVPAEASPGLGPVETVGDFRLLDSTVARLDCVAADGTRVRWEAGKEDPHNFWSELVLRRRQFDVDSGEYGNPVFAGEYYGSPVAMSCRPEGGVWLASGRYGAIHLERFDLDGKKAGYRDIGAPPWEGREEVQVSLPAERFLAFLKPADTFPEGETPIRQLAVLPYSMDAVLSSPTVVAQWDEDERLQRHAAAADTDGNVLLAWTVNRPGEPSQLWVRILDADAQPVADAQRIDDARFPTMPSLSVLATGSGEFLVAWKDSLPGWVGRRVSIGDLQPTTTTTSTTLPDVVGLPDFLPAATISDAPGLQGTPDLATDGKGLWMAAWRADASGGRVFAYVSMSADDGRTWSAPTGFPDATLAWQDEDHRDRPKHDIAIATDSDGTWMLALMHQPARWECYVEFWRSVDNGRTWQSPADALEEWEAPVRLASWRETYDDQRCGGMDLASIGDGEWLNVLGAVANGDERFDSRQLFVAWSHNNGDTWSELGDPIVDLLNEPAASAPIVVHGEAGQTALPWHAHGVHSYPWQGAKASTDWLPASDDDEMNENVPFGLAVGFDPSGTMVMAVPDRDPGPGGSGWDADIAVARSSDLGATWSQPEVVAPYAHGDGATDIAPAIAGDPDGRYLLAWNSNRGASGRLAGTPAVLYSFSSDRGASWAPPVLLDPASPIAATSDSVVGVASDRHGGWGVLLTSVLADGSHRIRFVRTRGSCGDGAVDVGEACDDGNLIDGDDCDSNCTPPICGNGILDAGETCDDGNPWSTDACREDCTPWRCGDGVAQLWIEECDDGNDDPDDDCTTECSLPRCGDGHVWRGGANGRDAEECEDGNSVDGDGCDSNCRWTGCGNGVVTDGEECDGGGATQGDCRPDCTWNVCGDGWLGYPSEQCDDANSIDNDDCRNTCVWRRCGDGVVSPPEQCDDTNKVNFDSCTNDCRLPRCGDRVLSREVEDCEDGNTGSGDGCSPDCRWEDLCGDADADGRVSASDARRILRRSVGLSGTCPRWACDVDGGGVVSASDAALALRKSVGLPINGNCLETFAVHLEASAPVAAVQFTMDYSRVLGTLTDEAGKLRCHWLSPDGIFAVPNLDRVAHFSLLRSAGTVPASSDLLECTIRRYAAPNADDYGFVIESVLDDEFDNFDGAAELSAVRVAD